MMKRIKIVLSITVMILLLVGCDSDSKIKKTEEEMIDVDESILESNIKNQEHEEDSDGENTLTVDKTSDYTEEYIIECLKKMPNILEVEAVTEKNDPNGRLKEDGWYYSAVFFSADLIDQEDVYGDTLIDKGTDAGGCVEAYKTVKDAESRNKHLAKYDDNILLNSGYHVVHENVVVRTSKELSEQHQKQLASNIVNILRGEMLDEIDIIEKIDEEKNDNKETNEEGEFYDFLFEGIDQFEFELNTYESSYVLKKYNYLSLDSSEEVVIPQTYNGLPVTVIDNEAFYSCESIKSVIIPEGVENIGACAFYQCDNLEKIVIPSSVHSIEEYAFYSCDALTEVIFPQAIDIGFWAFCECENLKTLIVGNETEYGEVTIGDYAFHACTNLESVTLGPCVSAIEGYAFSSCENLKTVNLSNGLTKIGNSAFEGCFNLEKINFDGTDIEWGSIDFWPWWDKYTGHYEFNFLK